MEAEAEAAGAKERPHSSLTADTDDGRAASGWWVRGEKHSKANPRPEEQMEDVRSLLLHNFASFPLLFRTDRTDSFSRND